MPLSVAALRPAIFFFFFYSLSKPTDTPKQSRRSRLWYIKSERKWKIDFSQNGIVELLTLFGNILMFSTDLKRKKKQHTHRRTENMYLHDTRRGKQCGVTWAKECRKWAKKSFITRNQLPNNWSWKRKTNLEHIYTHDVGPACTQE